MKLSYLSLAAALAIGSTAVLLPDTAEAQRINEQQRQQAQQGRQQARGQGQVAQLTPAENAAIAPVLQAVQAQDWATARVGLAAAQAAAQSPYARYVVGQLMFEIGRGANDQQLQAQAVDAMLASGGAPENQIRPLINNQVAFALRASNWTAAEAALTRLVELDPNDTERLSQLAQVKVQLNKRPEALALYQRLLQQGEASGQRASEQVYRQTLALAYEANMMPQAVELSQRLIAAYPTPDNLRTGVLIYRQAEQADGVLNLDIRRFMRAAGLLREGGEYVELADALRRGGLPGEVKAVLDEGMQRGAVSAGDADARQLMAWANENIGQDRGALAGLRTQALAGSSGRAARTTADALFGYGQYAEAAELYRAALQKGGEDADLVNIRLGAALALAGRRQEAETALRAVSGNRRGLANFWLGWLASRA
jgi:tetratricopeptide (TPR) repeat protein